MDTVWMQSKKRETALMPKEKGFYYFNADYIKAS
jgi:hypothetical protein